MIFPDRKGSITKVFVIKKKKKKRRSVEAKCAEVGTGFMLKDWVSVSGSHCYQGAGQGTTA